jgi:hypothetical protein
MKLFCAYAFTGEDLDMVKKRMRLVVDTLNSRGHDAYCNLDDPVVEAIKDKDDIPGIFNRAFEVLGEKEALVAIVTSPNKSLGQIMEVGTALSQGKPVYLFEHLSAKNSTYLPKLATETYFWDTLEDLKSALYNI